MIDKLNEIERSLDNLFGAEGIKTLSRQRVANEFERLAHNVEAVTRDGVLMSLKSSADVAHLYACSKQAINFRANRLKSKLGSFGWKIGPGMWVFTPDEVERLRPGPGRPLGIKNKQSSEER